MSTSAQPWSVSAGGLVVCAGEQEVSVRKTDGTAILREANGGGSFVISPDGRWLAMDGRVADVSGWTTSLPETFRPEGWLDNVTLKGGISPDISPQCLGSYELGYLRITAPSQVHDLGFCGDFVGVVN